MSEPHSRGWRVAGTGQKSDPISAGATRHDQHHAVREGRCVPSAHNGAAWGSGERRASGVLTRAHRRAFASQHERDLAFQPSERTSGRLRDTSMTGLPSDTRPPSKKLRIKDAAAFTPGSQAKAAWVSLEGGTLAAMISIAAVRGAASAGLLAALESIHSDPPIEALLELRNVHYHRWRGESSGVTGIDLGMKPASQLLAEGQPVTFGQELLPSYSGGAAALEQLGQTSLDALKALISHMDEFLGAWWALFSESFFSASTS